MPPCPTPAYHVKATQPLPFDRFTLKLCAKDDFFFPDFLRHVKAKILGHKTREKPTPMGYVNAQFVRVMEAELVGEDIWDIMDNHSEALACVYKGLWDQHGNSTAMLQGVKCDPMNLLYIDEVLLEAPYRGYGIGLLALNAVIESLSSIKAPDKRKWVVSLPFVTTEVEMDDIRDCDFVLLCPAGLTCVESMGRDLRHKAIEQKLMDHWIEEVVPHLVTEEKRQRFCDQRQAMLDTDSDVDDFDNGEELEEEDEELTADEELGDGDSETA
ncbi:hypothetical protein TI39_contig4250g00005 [Zymoseptoria brevis]|uniref:Uncharacterized protein n=1 Tax=Zymoseptoria brevis TaxID=1047168 RepID=A0A0F4G9X5_9PEZI|nr:hypothetical protein TI39_contig4250g00005 [Zymoseptoria brevis]